MIEFSLENVLFVYDVDVLHEMKFEEADSSHEEKLEDVRDKAVEIYR
jgi:hypothetical protein